MREQLNNRRSAITEKIPTNNVPLAGGETLLVTFGFDGGLTLDGILKQGSSIKEVFVASFRAAPELLVLVDDACIMFSRLLQYGDSLERLTTTLIENRRPEAISLIGHIAKAARNLQQCSDKGELIFPITDCPRVLSMSIRQMVEGLKAGHVLVVDRKDVSELSELQGLVEEGLVETEFIEYDQSNAIKFRWKGYANARDDDRPQDTSLQSLPSQPLAGDSRQPD